MASTTPLRLPWVTVGAAPSPDDFQWELYHGTPVIEDYEKKMPFQFTGRLEKLTIELGSQKLSAEEKRKLKGYEEASAQAADPAASRSTGRLRLRRPLSSRFSAA